MARLISANPMEVRVPSNEVFDIDRLTARAERFGVNVTGLAHGPVTLEGPVPVITRDMYRHVGGNVINPKSWGVLKLLAVSAERPVGVGALDHPTQPEAVWDFPDMPAKMFAEWAGHEVLLGNIVDARTLEPAIDWGRENVGDIKYFTESMIDDWEFTARALKAIC